MLDKWLEQGHSSVYSDALRGSVAVAGLTVSLATLNYVASLLTVLYLLAMLYVQVPKVLNTYRDLEAARAARKAAAAEKEDPADVS